MEIWKVPLIYLFGKYEKVLFGQVFVFISEVITCGFHFLSNHLRLGGVPKKSMEPALGLEVREELYKCPPEFLLIHSEVYSLTFCGFPNAWAGRKQSLWPKPRNPSGLVGGKKNQKVRKSP